MKLFSLLTILICMALAPVAAQTDAVGTVQVTQGAPPVPPVITRLVVTAGIVSVTITGNTFPATALTVTWTIGTSSAGPYVIPLAPTDSYVFEHRRTKGTVGVDLVSDAVTGICKNNAGSITCTLTGNGNNPPAVAF